MRKQTTPRKQRTGKLSTTNTNSNTPISSALHSGPEPRTSCPTPQTPSQEKQARERRQKPATPAKTKATHEHIMPPSEEVALLAQTVLPDPFKCMTVVDNSVWTGERNGTIIIRNALTVSPSSSVPNSSVYTPTNTNPAFVSSLCTVVSADQVWSGFSDGMLRVFAKEEHNIINETRVHSGCVTTLHVDAQYVYSGGQDWKVVKWLPVRGEAPQQLGVLSGHSNAIRCIVTDVGRGLLFTGSDDTTIRAWSPTAQTSAVMKKAHAGSVLCLCIPQTTQRLWSGGEDGAICVWNEHSNDLEGRHQNSHDAPISQVVSVPDDGRVITTDKHGVMLLWDPARMVVLQKLSPSEAGGAAWQRNSIQLAQVVQRQTQTRVWTCSADGAVRIWTTPSLSESDQVSTLRRELEVLHNTRTADVDALQKQHRAATTKLMDSFESRIKEESQRATPASPQDTSALQTEVQMLSGMVKARDGQIRVVEAELDAARQVLAKGVSQNEDLGVDVRQFLAEKKAEFDARLEEEIAKRAAGEAELHELRSATTHLQRDLQYQTELNLRNASAQPPPPPPPPPNSSGEVVFSPTSLPATLPDQCIELAELRSRADTAESHSASLQNELSRVTSILMTEREAVHSTHNAALDEVVMLKQTLILERTEHEAQMARLREGELIARQPSWEQELALCKAQLSDIAAERSHALQQLGDASARLLESESRVHELSSELAGQCATSEHEVLLQRSHIGELTKERADLLRQLSDASAKCVSAESSESQLRNQLCSRLGSEGVWEKEITEAQLRCEEMRREQQSTLHAAGAAETAARVAEMELAQLRAELDTLRSSANLSVSLGEQASQAAAEAHSLRTERDALKAELHTALTTLQQTTADLHHAQAANEHTTHLTSEVSSLQTEVLQLRENAIKMDADRAAIQASAEGVEQSINAQYRDAITSLERDYTELKSINSALTGAVQELESERDASRRGQAASADEIVTLRRIVQDLTGANDALTLKVGELDQVVTAHRDAADGSQAMSAQVAALTVENKRLSSELQTATATLTQTNAAAEEATVCRRTAEERVASAEASVQRMAKENEGMKAPWEQLQLVLADSQATLASVQAQFRDDVLKLEAQLHEKDTALSEQKRGLLEKDSLLAVQKGQLAALMSRQPVV